MPDIFQRIFSKEDFLNACEEMIRNLPNGIADAVPDSSLTIAIPLSGTAQDSVEVTISYQFDDNTYSVEESSDSPGIFKDIEVLDETTIPKALSEFVDGNDINDEIVVNSSVLSSVATANDDTPMFGNNEIVYVFGSDPDDAIRYLPPMSATAFAELLNDSAYSDVSFTANIQETTSESSRTLEQFSVVRSDDGEVKFTNDTHGEMTPSQLDGFFNQSEGTGLMFVGSDRDSHDIITSYELPAASVEDVRAYMGVANDEPSGTTNDASSQNNGPTGPTLETYQRSFSKEDFIQTFENAIQKLQDEKTDSSTTGTMSVSIPSKDEASDPVVVTVTYNYDDGTYHLEESENSPKIFENVDTLDNHTIPDTLTKYVNDNVDSGNITIDTSVLNSVITSNDIVPQIGEHEIISRTTKDDQTSTQHHIPPMSADAFAALYEKSGYSNGSAYISASGQENSIEQFDIIKNPDGTIGFHNDTEGTITPSRLDEIFAKHNETNPDSTDKYHLSFSCENKEGESVSTDDRLPQIDDSTVKEYLGIAKDKDSGTAHEVIDFDKEMTDRKADFDSRMSDIDKIQYDISGTANNIDPEKIPDLIKQQETKLETLNSEKESLEQDRETFAERREAAAANGEDTSNYDNVIGMIDSQLRAVNAQCDVVQDYIDVAKIYDVMGDAVNSPHMDPLNETNRILDRGFIPAPFLPNEAFVGGINPLAVPGLEISKEDVDLIRNYDKDGTTESFGKFLGCDMTSGAEVIKVDFEDVKHIFRNPEAIAQNYCTDEIYIVRYKNSEYNDPVTAHIMPTQATGEMVPSEAMQKSEPEQYSGEFRAFDLSTLYLYKEDEDGHADRSKLPDQCSFITDSNGQINLKTSLVPVANPDSITVRDPDSRDVDDPSSMNMREIKMEYLNEHNSIAPLMDAQIKDAPDYTVTYSMDEAYTSICDRMFADTESRYDTYKVLADRYMADGQKAATEYSIVKTASDVITLETSSPRMNGIERAQDHMGEDPQPGRATYTDLAYTMQTYGRALKEASPDGTISGIDTLTQIRDPVYKNMTFLLNYGKNQQDTNEKYFNADGHIKINGSAAALQEILMYNNLFAPPGVLPYVSKQTTSPELLNKAREIVSEGVVIKSHKYGAKMDTNGVLIRGDDGRAQVNNDDLVPDPYRITDDGRVYEPAYGVEIVPMEVLNAFTEATMSPNDFHSLSDIEKCKLLYEHFRNPEYGYARGNAGMSLERFTDKFISSGSLSRYEGAYRDIFQTVDRYRKEEKFTFTKDTDFKIHFTVERGTVKAGENPVRTSIDVEFKDGNVTGTATTNSSTVQINSLDDLKAEIKGKYIQEGRNAREQNIGPRIEYEQFTGKNSIYVNPNTLSGFINGRFDNMKITHRHTVILGRDGTSKIYTDTDERYYFREDSANGLSGRTISQIINRITSNGDVLGPERNNYLHAVVNGDDGVNPRDRDQIAKLFAPKPDPATKTTNDNSDPVKTNTEKKPEGDPDPSPVTPDSSDNPENSTDTGDEEDKDQQNSTRAIDEIYDESGQPFHATYGQLNDKIQLSEDGTSINISDSKDSKTTSVDVALTPAKLKELASEADKEAKAKGLSTEERNKLFDMKVDSVKAVLRSYVTEAKKWEMVMKSFNLPRNVASSHGTVQYAKVQHTNAIYYYCQAGGAVGENQAVTKAVGTVALQQAKQDYSRIDLLQTMVANALDRYDSKQRADNAIKENEGVLFEEAKADVIKAHKVSSTEDGGHVVDGTKMSQAEYDAFLSKEAEKLMPDKIQEVYDKFINPDKYGGLLGGRSTFKAANGNIVELKTYSMAPVIKKGILTAVKLSTVILGPHFLLAFAIEGIVTATKTAIAIAEAKRIERHAKQDITKTEKDIISERGDLEKGHTQPNVDNDENAESDSTDSNTTKEPSDDSVNDESAPGSPTKDGTDNSDEEPENDSPTKDGTDSPDEEPENDSPAKDETDSPDEEPENDSPTKDETDNPDEEPENDSPTKDGTDNPDEEPENDSPTKDETDNPDEEPENDSPTKDRTDNSDEEPENDSPTKDGTDNPDEEPENDSPTKDGTDSPDEEPENDSPTKDGTDNPDEEPENDSPTKDGTDNPEEESDKNTKDDENSKETVNDEPKKEEYDTEINLLDTPEEDQSTNDNTSKNLTNDEDEDERQRKLIDGAAGSATNDDDSNPKVDSDDNKSEAEGSIAHDEAHDSNNEPISKTVDEESDKSNESRTAQLEQNEQDTTTSPASEGEQSAQLEASEPTNSVEISPLMDEINHDNAEPSPQVIPQDDDASQPIVKGDVIPEHNLEPNTTESDKTDTTPEEAMVVQSQTPQESHQDTEEEIIKSALDDCINNGSTVQDCLDTIDSNRDNIDFSSAKDILSDAIVNLFESDIQGNDTDRDTMQLASDLVYGMADMFNDDQFSQTLTNITEIGDTLIEKGMNDSIASSITDGATKTLTDSVITTDITSQFGDLEITYSPDEIDGTISDKSLNDLPSQVTDLDGFLMDESIDSEAMIQECDIAIDGIREAFETGQEAAKIITDECEAKGNVLSDSQISEIENLCFASAYNMQQDGQSNVAPMDVVNSLNLDAQTQNATNDALMSAIETRDALQNSESIVSQPDMTNEAFDTTRLGMESMQADAQRQSEMANDDILHNNEDDVPTTQNLEVEQINNELGASLRDITNESQTEQDAVMNTMNSDDQPDDFTNDNNDSQQDSSVFDELDSTAGSTDDQSGADDSGDEGGDVDVGEFLAQLGL